MNEDKRPPMPQNFQWYSVCSAVHENEDSFDPTCVACNAGHWVNDEFHELDHWLYVHDPKLWRKWANRETKEGEPGHKARHFLESVFPGLRPKITTSVIATSQGAAPATSCNRHSNCEAAIEKWLAEHPGMKRWDIPFSFHCHDDECEDCFGN